MPINKYMTITVTVYFLKRVMRIKFLAITIFHQELQLVVFLRGCYSFIGPCFPPISP